jgi:hypothetical protein
MAENLRPTEDRTKIMRTRLGEMTEHLEFMKKDCRELVTAFDFERSQTSTYFPPILSQNQRKMVNRECSFIEDRTGNSLSLGAGRNVGMTGFNFSSSSNGINNVQHQNSFSASLDAALHQSNGTLQLESEGKPSDSDSDSEISDSRKCVHSNMIHNVNVFLYN